MAPQALRRLDPVIWALPAALLGALAVRLAYETHPLVPLAGLAATGAAVLALLRPMWVLYAAVALVPLELFSLPLGGASLTPTEGLFALAGLGWALSRLLQGQLPLVDSPLTKPLGLLILAIVPGFAVAQESFPLVKTLLMWTCFFLAFQMVVADGRVSTVRRLLILLALAGAVVGVVAGVQSLGQEQELQGLGQNATGRAVGTFESPNSLATLLALALPAALALGLSGPLALRPVMLAGFVALLAGLSLSLSRGGLLAAAGALIMMLVWRPFRRAAIGAAMVMVFFLVAIGGSPLGQVQQVDTVTQRLSTVGSDGGSKDPRIDIWQSTPEIIRDNFWVGLGSDQFEEATTRYGIILPASQGGTRVNHPHNIVLTIAVELGVLGLIAIGWLAVALVGVLFRACRRAQGADAALAFAVAAAFLAVALQGVVDYTLRSNVLAATVFMLAGAAVVLSRIEPGSAPDAKTA